MYKYLLISVLLFSCAKENEKKSNETSLKSSESIMYVVDTKGGNIRNGAGMNASILLTAPFGAKIKVLGNSEFGSEWQKVEYNSNFGYMHQSVLGTSEVVANNVPLKATQDNQALERKNEIDKAKEVYNNIGKYIFVTTDLISGDCLFGGGSAVITFKNASHCKLETVIVDVEIAKGNETVLEVRSFTFSQIAPFTEYPKEIKFNFGCKVKASIRCITSDYLGIYTCKTSNNEDTAPATTPAEVQK